MYWRIKTIDPKELAKKWGVPIALGVSLFFNVLLIATRPNPKVEGPEGNKQTIEQFVYQVATHLVDSSYINYEDNTKKLLGGELGSQVVKKMQSNGDLPKDNLEMAATLEGLKARRQVAAVHIADVSAGDPDENGLVPVTVKGEVAVNSADESGPSGPQPFNLKLLIGVKSATGEHVVADIKER
ncbi:MAG: hypothetical protein K2Y22_05150 [Candidatus Obscuribacterales bacterium]|nr:hypothetical protein [Candidatus Obscuribacterales bacterium]